MFSALIRTTDGESGCGVLGSSSAAYEVSDRLAFASDSGPASELQSMHAPSLAACAARRPTAKLPEESSWASQRVNERSFGGVGDALAIVRGVVDFGQQNRVCFASLRRAAAIVQQADD